MYRKNVEKEEGLTKNYYTFTVFDGKFVECIRDCITGLDVHHLVAICIVVIAGCCSWYEYLSRKYPEPPQPMVEMSSMERCMRGPVDNNRCIEIYDKETQRLKELSTELIRREIETMKNKQEAEITNKQVVEIK